MAVGLTRSGAKNPVAPAHRVPAHLARRFHQICLGAMSEFTVPAGLTPGEYGILAQSLTCRASTNAGWPSGLASIRQVLAK